jgi:ATP-dependent DNA helicase RecG
VSSRDPYRPQPLLTADAVDPVDRALEALRGEWRAGFNGTRIRAGAFPAIQALHTLASTRQSEDEVRMLLLRLDRYHGLTIEQRKAELQALAASVTALRPHLRQPGPDTREFGKLNEAVAPGRAPSRPAAPKVERPLTTQRPPRATPTPERAPRPIDPAATITAIPHLGDKWEKLFAKLDLTTVGDLVRLLPRRHLDYSRTILIGQAALLGSGATVTVRGQITAIKEIHSARSGRVEARLDDGTGWIRVVWFNRFIARTVHEGDEIAVSGTISADYGRPSIDNPEWEFVGKDGLSTGGLVPIYPLTAGLTQKTVRRFTRAALDATRTSWPDPLPDSLLERHHLVALHQAYEAIHFPVNEIALEDGRRRLMFDEMLLLQIGFALRRRSRTASSAPLFRIDDAALARFEEALPFRYTGAQRRVVGDILTDLRGPHPMARLLQGDVGSGKTAVAATAAWFADRSGYQTAVLAPTEILAAQHEQNFRRLFANLPEAERPVVGFLSGSTKARERREILAAVIEGEIDVLVGTHAIITQRDDERGDRPMQKEPVEFRNLGLVIVDEQHRFGVRQRQTLGAKAGFIEPHVLSMTATPIPRTLNAVVHGDLEVSIIDELPPGRIPIETRLHQGRDQATAYDLVREQVELGHQTFVVCPLIEESDTTEAKAAVAEAERLQNEVFPDLRVRVLHGRMPAKEKDAIMAAFREREFDILVSTTVIEVGIDIPNASVMVIEGADRFGLAQLHQLRGRVGRGGTKSWCLLLTDDPGKRTERLELMVQTNDGFVLAEADLRLRGPGDFFGTRQSGLPDTPLLAGEFDSRLFDEARDAATRLLTADPDLRAPDLQELRVRVATAWKDTPGLFHA